MFALNWSRPHLRSTAATRLLSTCILIVFAIQPVLAMEVPITQEGEVYQVKVLVNDLLYLPFIIDSGASDVQVGPEELMLLMKNGAVQKGDLLPPRDYETADGKRTRQKRFIIRKMRLGALVVHDVNASISPQLGVSLLLGQSFLRKLGSWRLDYQRSMLVVDEAAAEPPVAAATAWPQYKEPDGTFEISLPVEPKVEHDPKTGLVSVVAVLPGGESRAFAVLRHKLDQPITEEEVKDKDFLPTFISSFEKTEDAMRVQHYDQFTFRGFPCISVLAVDSSSKVYDMLCVFCGSSLYQIMTMRPQSSTDFDDNAITQFVQSFHLGTK